MIALKKIYSGDCLRLAMILSLLRGDHNDNMENETQQLLTGLLISNGSDWSLEHEARTLIRPRFVHPKSLDNILINYERELFAELNSLGRYANTFENNDRMWNNQGPVHTYLVNNVATETVVPTLATASVPDEELDQDGVYADDNVAEEVKIEEVSSNELDENNFVNTREEQIAQPDAVVTLSGDFFSNRTESDIFAEIATRSFDVNELLVQPNDMLLKVELDNSEESDFDFRFKKEEEDLYEDNAIDYVSYFAAKSEKLELGEPYSVFDQSAADLQDYEELYNDVKGLKNDLDALDVKQQNENLEQYLLENTPLDTEICELSPMFQEDIILDIKRERAGTSFTSASSSGVSEMDLGSEVDIKLETDEGSHKGDELTQEDMDLIEVLWKQDVDMGYCLNNPLKLDGPQATKVDLPDIESELKLTEAKSPHTSGGDDGEKRKETLLDTDNKEEDPWAGLHYTIDTETGEYLLQGELPRELNEDEPQFDLLEEALQLVELTDKNDEPTEQTDCAVESGSGVSENAEEGTMLHPAMRHVPHHLAHYHNQSLMRSMSMEQRWQDLATLLPIPHPPEHYQHYHHPQHPHNISAHAAHAAGGYAPNYHTPLAAVPEKHPEPYGAAAPLDAAYKVESAHQPQPHDGIFYQNSTSEMAPPAGTSDGFLQSILNDEDLQLMDMAMNEGMYTMRMLDSASAQHHAQHAHTHMMMQAERDSASDSAVSSMGSERVPSLSDGEWCDGSDSAQEFHSSKFRPYDSTYGRERSGPQPPQKKHHMFGKRCFQEQNPQPLDPLTVPPAPGVAVKYECPEQTYHHEAMQVHNNDFGSRTTLAGPHATPVQPALDLHSAHATHTLLQSPDRCAYATPERVRHNHTYSAHSHIQTHAQHTDAAAAEHAARQILTRDKRVRRCTDGSISDGGSSSGAHSLSRDEKRAKALGIPIEVHDIINLPMDEFNERLSKHDLSEAQLSLIRDIRRRGKNKVAAQNCRKRKLDQITSLADEVRLVRDRKQRTLRDHHTLMADRQRIKERFATLYRHVFQSLRDAEGRPLSSNQFSLQQAADGNVVLVPKMNQHQDNALNRTSDDEIERKAKNYEQ